MTAPWKLLHIYRETSDQRVAKVEVGGNVLLLRQELGGSSPQFRQEIECLRRVESDWVTRIHSTGIDSDGVPYLLREYVDGVTLADEFASKSERKPEVLAGLLEALQVVHREGLCHGDLKPANVLLPQDGTVPVKLADFGLGRWLPAPAEGGTAFYVPPESLFGWPLDERSDLFSLGVLLFEWWGGVLPKDPARFYTRFPAAPLAECLDLSALSPARQGLLRRLCAIDPERRPSSCLELAEELQRMGEIPQNEGLSWPHQISRAAVLEDFRESCDQWFERGGLIKIGPCNEEQRSLLLRELSLFAVARQVPLWKSLQQDNVEQPFVVWFRESASVWNELASLRKTKARAPRLFVMEGEEAKSDPRVDELIRAPALDTEQALKAVFALELREADQAKRDFAEKLCRYSRGSVTAANLILRRLHQDGWMDRQAGRPRIQRNVPFAELAAQSLSPPHVDSQVRQLWSLLQVHARAVSWTMFEMLCATQELDPLPAMQTLRKHGLIQSIGSGSWAPPYALDSQERERAHRRLAQALEENDRAAEALPHYVAARDWDSAADVVSKVEEGDPGKVSSLGNCVQTLLEQSPPRLTREPERLFHCAALLAAVGERESCLECLRALRRRRKLDPELRRRVLRLLGDTLLQHSAFAEAETVYLAGLNEVEEPARRPPFARGLADLWLRQGNARQARRLLQKLEPEFAEFDWRDVLQLKAQMALAELHSGQIDAAVDLLKRSLAEARRRDDAGAIAMLLTNLALAERRRGKTAAAIRATQEALGIQERRGATHQEAHLHRNLGVYLREHGEVQRARHHLENAKELHKLLGEWRSLGTDLASLGILALELGLYAQAGDFFAKATPWIEQYGEERDRLILAVARCRFALETGHWRGLSRRLEELLPQTMAAEVAEVEQDARSLVIELAIRKKRWEAAHRSLALAVDRAAAQADPRIAQRHLLWQAVLRRHLGDESGAARFLKQFQLQVKEETLRNEGLLEELLQGGDDPDPDLLLQLEQRARLHGNRRQLLEVLFWRQRWHEAKRDRHGASAMSRGQQEVLEEMTRADPRFSHARLLAAARGLRNTAFRRVDLTARSESKDMNDNLELLRTFLAINKRLAAERDSRQLLQTMLETALSLTGAHRGFLILVDADGIRFECSKSLRNAALKEPDRELSSSFLQEALQTGRPLITSNAGADPRFRDRQSVAKLDLRSILCVPFPVDEQQNGALYLDNPIREGAFSDRELELMDALSDQVALALRNLNNQTEIEALNSQLKQTVQLRESQLLGAKRTLQREGLDAEEDGDWVGESPQFVEAGRLLERFAGTEMPVLITGESGTGKEMAARKLHRHSARASAPFISENCTAIPETLMEAEFFGVKKGAFTGADQDRDGLFVLADGGTLLLDEIGDLPLSMQAKLLRALQEGVIRKVGGSDPIQVNVRIVATTNRDLQALIKTGEFREDLFYRLAAAQVELPPLRERKEDIPLLALHFVRRFNATQERGFHIARSTLEELQQYDWPGNVRQLQNEIHKGFALAETSEICWQHPSVTGDDTGLAAGEWPFRESLTLRELERAAILAELRRQNGNKNEAAKALGISRASIYERIRRHQLDV